jgi:hypothetical protein
VHSLSQICRRVRRSLLPKLYRFVRLLRPNNKRRLSFLELAPMLVSRSQTIFRCLFEGGRTITPYIPMHGHICEKLAFRIPGAGASFCTLVKLLRDRCKDFTNLRTLQLDLRLDDGPNSSDKRYESSCVSVNPGHRKMTARELVGRTCAPHFTFTAFYCPTLSQSHLSDKSRVTEHTYSGLKPCCVRGNCFHI